MALFRSVYLCLPLLIYFLQGCLFLTPLCYLIIAYIGSYQVLSLITEYDCLIVWVYMYKNLRIFNIFVINFRPYLGIYFRLTVRAGIAILLDEHIDRKKEHWKSDDILVVSKQYYKQKILTPNRHVLNNNYTKGKMRTISINYFNHGNGFSALL